MAEVPFRIRWAIPFALDVMTLPVNLSQRAESPEQRYTRIFNKLLE
jgi:hypothetical protein